MPPAKAGFPGLAHDLLQWRVGNQESIKQAGPCRIGAAQLRWRGCAVRLRISGVGRYLGYDLVSRADNGIEALKVIGAIQRGADLVFELDVGNVEPTAGGH